VQKYFHQQKVLYVFSAQPYKSYYAPYSDEERPVIFVRDVGATYVAPAVIKNYLKAKTSCILTRTVEFYLERLCPFIGAYGDAKTKRVTNIEERRIEAVEMQFIPQNMSEFRNSKYYIIPSQIKRYCGFLPNAKPIDKLFNGEPIFLKRDQSELHSKDRWQKYSRKVKQGEQPLKVVKSILSEKEKMIEMYGYWQTEKWTNTLTADGKIPRVIYTHTTTIFLIFHVFIELIRQL
jgi:hypothetical protein